MKYFFVLLFLFGCSSVQKQKFAGFHANQAENSADGESKHYQNDNGHHLFLSLAMENLNQEEASRLFQNRKNYLKSLFQNDRDPYLSKTIRSDDCLKNLNLDGMAIDQSKFESLAFDLPSTENFVLGQCNPKLESYEAQIYFFYCKERKSFYELKYFRPKNSLSAMSADFERLCDDK